MVDKYYFIKGGAERYFFELKKILEKQGNEVFPFSVANSQNYPSKYEPYFVNEIEFNGLSKWEKAKKWPKIVGRILFSGEAQKKIEKLINKVKPDIAHLHMIDHQISPSILFSLKRHGIPVFQTIHQYKLVCPNYRLYNMRTGSICEKCLDGYFYHPIFEKCHKDSSIDGAILFLEASLHKALKSYKNNVDIFHVPSRFMGEKLIQGGLDAKKIRKLYYTINIADYPFSAEMENYILYYGRLSREKGILTLLKAMKKWPEIKLVVVGDGPQKKELVEFAASNRLNNIHFAGNKWGDELKQLVSRSKFIVVPSEWYDNSPLVIYESFSMGKPVIGADIGGISELVDHDLNGFLFDAGDEADLAGKIKNLWDDMDKIVEFGKNARAKAEQEFSPEYHYKEMMKMYRELIYG